MNEAESSVDGDQGDLDYRTRTYNEYISKRYNLSSSFQARYYRRWAQAAEKRFEGWLPAESDVPILDLGCGHGNFLYLLEENDYLDLTGVDLGTEQLALAARYAPTAKLVEEDMFAFLTNQENQFGLIACLNVIEHFNRRELFQLLELLTDALQPGGRVIFETPNAESPWFGAVAYADLTHEWFFTPRALKDAIRLFDLEGFEARPSEPVRSGAKGWVRNLAWKLFQQYLMLWNLAETGSVGSGIYTRVFVATATKRRL